MSMMGLRLGRTGADRLMPMHLVLDEEGRVLHAGPALEKVADRPLAGCPMAEVLRFCRPFAAAAPASFEGLAGRALQVELLPVAEGRAPVPLRAVLVTLPQGGALLHLSPGVRLARTVREHGLDATDFSPVDPSVELLFMHEAQALVRGEMERLASGDGGTSACDGGPADRAPHADADVGTDLDRAMSDPSFGFLKVALTGGNRAGRDRLREIAARGLRERDTVIDLPDGVMLLLPGCTADAAAAAAARLRRHLARLTEDGTLPAVTISAWSAARLDDHGETGDDAGDVGGVSANGFAYGDRSASAPEATAAPPA